MVEQKLTKRFTVLLIRYGQKLVFSIIKVAQVSPPSFLHRSLRANGNKSQTGKLKKYITSITEQLKNGQEGSIF